MNNFIELVDELCTKANPSHLFMGCVSMRTAEFWQQEYSMDKFTGASVVFSSKQADNAGTKAIYEFFRAKTVTK
jgi:hypothetical protein